MKTDLEANDITKPLLVDCPPSIRSAFLKKVYALLGFQLLLTSIVAGLMMFQPDMHKFVTQNPQAMYASSIAALFVFCPLVAYKDRHPWNLCLLLLFTAFEACAIGNICALYTAIGLEHLVIASMLTTLCLFGGLTAIVHVTNRDFYFLETFLSFGVIVLIVMTLVGWFFVLPVFHVLVAMAGVTVFSGFILYDTSEMIRYMGPDDALIAAVQLYLDIVNLFLYLLQLFGICSDSNA